MSESTTEPAFANGSGNKNWSNDAINENGFSSNDVCKYPDALLPNLFRYPNHLMLA